MTHSGLECPDLDYIPIYLYLQYIDRQADLDPRPQPATVQPIRACPEDPWGPFSPTSALLEASPPGHWRAEKQHWPPVTITAGPAIDTASTCPES